MSLRPWLALLLLAAPQLSAQTLRVPDQTGAIATAGQVFVVQYTPGADSGAFDFALAASPSANLTITAASASIPNGLVSCSHTAVTVTCTALATSPANDLGAGTISVTYTAAAIAGPIALSFTSAEFGDQEGGVEPGTTIGGTLTLPRGPQAALSATAAPSALVFGGSAALSASGGSGGGALTWSVTAGASHCSVAGSTLTATGVGDCTVSVTKAGDANYLPASASTTVTVSRAPQAALTASASPQTLALGGSSALSTSGGSGSGAVVWSISSGGSVCTLSGSTLTGSGVGQCTVTATKAADANYLSATASVTVTVTPAPGAQALSVPDGSGRINTGGQAFVIQYTPGSGAGGFDFTLAASPAGRITPSSAVASIPNGSATCSVTGSQVACSVAASTPGVDLGAGQVTVAYAAGATAGDVALAFTASAFHGHGGASAPGTATGGTLSLLRNPQATLSLSATPGTLVFGASASLATTGGSGSGAVTYAVSSGAGVCAVSGATLMATGVGNCTVTATKAADAAFEAATASVVVGVSRAPQATLSALASPATILRGGSSALSTSGGSGGGAVSYAVTAGGSVCSVSGATLSGTGVGQCTVTATRAGDAQYLSATATTTVTVNPLPSAQSLSIPNATGILQASGQTFVVQYTPGQDSGGFDFNLAASPAGRITITGVSHAIPNSSTSCTHTAGSVTCVSTALTPSVDLGQGTVTVTYQAGATAGPVALQFGVHSFFDQNGNVEAGSTTNGTLSLPALAQAPLVASASPSTLAFGATAALSTSGGSGSGAVSWSVSAGAGVCSVSGATLTATGVGSCSLTATKAGDATFAPVSATVGVTVVRALQAPLSVSATPATLDSGGSAALSTSGGTGTGAVSYAITSGAGACAVGGATLTAVAPGACTVTATKAADAHYEAATATVQVTVRNSLPTLTLPASVATREDLPSAPVAITIGDAETSAAALQLSATSSNAALVADAGLPAGFGGSGANRSLVVTPVANANGSATVTVSVTDANGGVRSAAIAVSVSPVNDAPDFAVPSVLTVAPGASGPQQRGGFASGVVFGPPDEQSSQAVQSYAVSESSDPAGVVSAAALAADGTLSFTLSGTPGVADLLAVLTDNGGTADGGVAQSAPVPFRIVVPLAADVEVSLGNARPHVLPGDVVTWELRVANAGPSPANGARVVFAVPAGVAGASWQCASVVGAACTAASAAGGIDQTVDLPVGGVLRYVLTGTVQAAVGAVLNATASASLPLGLVDPDTGDNAAVDNDPVVPEVILGDDFEGAGGSSVAGGDAAPRD